MTLRKELQDLIEEKIELIETGNFDELFPSCDKPKNIMIPHWTHLKYELADVLLSCGIDYTVKSRSSAASTTRFIKDLRLSSKEVSGRIKGPYKTKYYSLNENECAIILHRCISDAAYHHPLNLSEKFKNYYNIVRIEHGGHSDWSWNILVFSST